MAIDTGDRSAIMLSMSNALTAWDVIGHDGDEYIRIVGGRTLYETAIYYDDTPGERVKLARIDNTGYGLRQVNRYVDPDTPVELVRV